MAKYIYFVEGYLTDREKPFSEIYFDKMKSIYKAEAKGYWFGVSVFPKEFEFVRVGNCTEKQFEGLWADKDTAGIVIYSHGTQLGQPWLYNDESYPALKCLDPAMLPKSGKNLRGISVLSCFSSLMEPTWKSKMKGRDPAVNTISGKLEDGGLGRNDGTLNWIQQRDGSLRNPAIGSRSFFKYIMGQLDSDTGSGGLECNVGAVEQTRADRLSVAELQPREVFRHEPMYLPFRRVPTVGTDAGQFTVHQIRHGDRVRYLAEDYGYADRDRFTADVERLNPGIDFTRLKPGQQIRVPTKIGVPFNLRVPWASSRGGALRTAGNAQGAPPTLFAVLGAQLDRTPSPAESGADRTVGSMASLERLERQVAQCEAQQRWLQQIDRDLSARTNVARTAGHDHSRASTFDVLRSALDRTPSADRTRDFVLTNTNDLLGRMERDAASREESRRFLDRVTREYGAPARVTASAADRGNTLSYIGRGLGDAPAQSFADRSPLPGDTMSLLRHMEQQPLRVNLTHQFLNPFRR